MKMYVYKFELEDGSSVEYKTQGIFSNTTEDLENRKLVKSAVIIDEYEVADEPVGEVVEQAE